MSAVQSILLAQQSRIADLGRNFRGANSELSSKDLFLVSFVVIAVAILVAVLKRLSRETPQRPTNSPRRLFRDLCRLHGLDRSTRRLLKRLARQQQLDHPSRLFVEPERFDAHNLGSLAGDQRRLHAIRQRLFGAAETYQCQTPGRPERL